MLRTEHENCWVCDKWTYTLVFFNPAQLQSSNAWDQCDALKEHVIAQLQKFHGSTSIEVDADEHFQGSVDNINVDTDEVVQCFGGFTNWEPKNMIPFLQYIEILDKDKPDFIRDI